MPIDRAPAGDQQYSAREDATLLKTAAESGAAGAARRRQRATRCSCRASSRTTTSWRTSGPPRSAAPPRPRRPRHPGADAVWADRGRGRSVAGCAWCSARWGRRAHPRALETGGADLDRLLDAALAEGPGALHRQVRHLLALSAERKDAAKLDRTADLFALAQIAGELSADERAPRGTASRACEMRPPACA